MNILLINHYAGSPQHGMEFRPYYLAREWVRAGHKVRILGADFSHVRSHQPKRNFGAQATWCESIEGIDYQWFATPKYKGNGVSRVRNIATFLGRVFFASRQISDEFKLDVVIASSTYPMDIWLARRFAKLANAKLIFEVHDLWPLSPIEIGGMSPSHPFIRLCQAAEDAAYRDADLVVSMLPNVAAHAAQKGLPLERLVVVSNGVSLDDWEDKVPAPVREDIRAAIDAAHAVGHLVVAYTGSHGLPNALDTLLDAAALLRNEELTFILVGDGHERLRLQARCRVEGLINVQMFDPVPKAQMVALLASVDMAYLGAPKHPIYRFGVSPNKMIDYMMARVPILYAIEAGNDPVAEAGCGLAVLAEASIDLAKSIRELASLSPSARMAMGEKGRSYALAHHTYDVLAAKFIKAVEKIGLRK
ncbi:glycosyltransferase family 4 protein [Limnohabitans sp.]|uniref:glycosyltransferase family 4 protein n=1 Tax=Limnohabitans sp. TaxID=1907725 RepID=UPI00286EEBF5|nr:glycosyltransferase family 4 protein [Limnohabitans sp.]